MAAKVDNSLPTLLSNLTASLTSATEIVPTQDAADTPKDGISLLDVKNELLLSYLQNLVFLILLKLRNNTNKKSTTAGDADDEEDEEDAGQLGDAVVKKLCELRLYLEKGARPLEGKLKYQIDKVVRAADDAARAEAAQQQQSAAASKKTSKKQRGSDDEDDSDDSDASSSAADIDELAYRPNPASFGRAAAAPADDSKHSKKDADPADAIYRPPRINATSMPEHLPRHGGREERDNYGPRRAAAIDDFVDEHMATAPVAQPSIGSNVTDGGRRIKSARERAADEERRAYEETNFVRLAKPGKKERAQLASRQKSAFGGEEWRELGAGVDRIERLTSKKAGGSRGGTKGALERSRKRAVDDGPRDSGAGGPEAGAMFAKRRKVAGRRK